MRGRLSVQVLQEFYVAATKKLGITPLDAKGLVHSLRRYEVVQIAPLLVEGAIDCSILDQLSFWDALVVQAALSIIKRSIYAGRNEND
jgi:predicted nucleic acid-binding protein